MYVPSVVHLKFVDASLNATVACDEYRYKHNIALGPGLLEGQNYLQWIKIIHCMKLASA